jgi:hypothetical protein
MPIVDLHAHTTFSDGTSSPSEVVYAYKKAGVQIMSITDHDTLEALPQAEVLAKNAGILFVPGVEISSREHDHLHILGYNIDPQNKILQEALALNREKRNIRAKKIIKQLQDAGVNITEEDVFKLVKNVASRAHIADAIRNKKIAPSRQEAFRKYLIPGKPGYAPNEGLSVCEVISLIKQAGGKAFMAHLGIVQEFWNFPAWVSSGLDGIEVYYPSHKQAMRDTLLSLTKKYNLLISAGSDHHGQKSGRDNAPGMQVPQEVFDLIKKNLCK